MQDCRSVEMLAAPYADGSLSLVDRASVEAHLQACLPCRRRFNVERAVHAALTRGRPGLCAETAPPALYARCEALRRGEGAPSFLSNTPAPSRAGAAQAARPAASWRARLTGVALAASLVLVVGAAFLYQFTSSSARLLVAELTADHVKCFALNAILRTHPTDTAVEASLAHSFGWNAHLPEHIEQEGLELVGSRPCLYGGGVVAHIMYRHHGTPMSVFVLPRGQMREELREAFGHEAAIWSAGDRTFVLISRERREDVERVASYVHASIR